MKAMRFRQSLAPMLIANILLSGCSNSPEERVCEAYDRSSGAIEARVLGSLPSESALHVTHCSTELTEAGSAVEEMCVLRADPKRPSLLANWERGSITFAPSVVMRAAREYDIALAMVFTLAEGESELYADDDLSELIAYRRFSRCSLAG